MRGENDKAIVSATKAIICQTETQPNSSTGAAYAQRAFAKDVKIHSVIQCGKSVEELSDEIQSAIADYMSARRFGCTYENVEIRIQILKALLPSEMEAVNSSDEMEERLNKVEHVLAELLGAIQRGNADENEEQRRKNEQLTVVKSIKLNVRMYDFDPAYIGWIAGFS